MPFIVKLSVSAVRRARLILALACAQRASYRQWFMSTADAGR